MIYQLHKRGILVFEENKPFLNDMGTFLLSNNFRNEFENFESFINSKCKPYGIDESLFENENDVDPSSSEYCLKYDAIDDLAAFDNLTKKLDGVLLSGVLSHNILIFYPFLDFLAQ